MDVDGAVMGVVPARDGLRDPAVGVGREGEAAGTVELLSGTTEADIALLKEVAGDSTAMS